MQPDLELALLRTFVAVVETGGLTSAGKRIGRTQPAVTHQLGRLEERVGRPLFAEDRRRLTLTREGEVLLEYARSMLSLNDEAVGRLNAPSIEGKVALGTPDLYAAFILPEVLKAFSYSHPNVEIQLRCTRSVHLYSALERGELDVALMTNQPEFRGGEFVRDEPIAWVSGKRGRPERSDPLPLALLPEGSIYRQLALEALRSAGLRWTVRSVSDSIAGLQAAVFSGLAVGIFPRCAVNEHVRPLGPAETMPPLPPVQLVIHRRPGGVSNAAEHLAQFIARELVANAGRYQQAKPADALSVLY